MLTQHAVSSSSIIMAELHQTSAFMLVVHLLNYKSIKKSGLVAQVSCILFPITATVHVRQIPFATRVSFRKMGKGGAGQNDTYEKNGGGGKGSARDSAPAWGSWGMLPQKIFEFYTL